MSTLAPPRPLLQVQGLVTRIGEGEGALAAVDHVSLQLQAGEVLGVIGESGSGKSTLAMSIMRLLPPNLRSTEGRILLDGQDLLALGSEDMQKVRGRQVAMIQQNPMVSLDPLFTVGAQLTGALAQHLGLDRAAATQRAIELLRLVSIPSPQERLRQYPHQMSGGMLQRIVGAIALAGEPRLLIADEPTTALDPTVQAQFLELLDELRRARRLAILLVTHDLTVTARLADQMAVMYAGRIVEQQPAQGLYRSPAHPYTQALLSSVRLSAAAPRTRLPTIAGQPPRLDALPAGCAFAPRCPHAHARCSSPPPDVPLAGGGQVACWLHQD